MMRPLAPRPKPAPAAAERGRESFSGDTASTWEDVWPKKTPDPLPLEDPRKTTSHGRLTMYGCSATRRRSSTGAAEHVLQPPRDGRNRSMQGLSPDIRRAGVPFLFVLPLFNASLGREPQSPSTRMAAAPARRSAVPTHGRTYKIAGLPQQDFTMDAAYEHGVLVPPWRQ
jgi:hypothetical protein